MKNIYVCGPTVYSSPHIGNMRPIITFDIYRRALEALGEEVNFIHNITDIDDKIIEKAIQKKITEKNIAKMYEEEYKDLLKQANVIEPNSMPKVVEHIQDIVNYIENLINNDYAYESNGNVFFSIKSVEGYGKFSNKIIEKMKYEDGVGKKHPADFALWKNTKVGIKFNSPWGKGRPGWHTECAVFIQNAFKGKPVDIHGGGIDLIFPHHENENAQHMATYGNNIALEWKHVGYLNSEGEKMSKSLGNILSAQSYFNHFSADTLRYIFLTSSYSSPINLTEKSSQQAFDRVEKFRKIYLKSQMVSSKKVKIVLTTVANDLKNWHFSSAMKSVNKIVKDFNKNETTKTANKVMAAMELLGFYFTNKVLSKNEKKLLDKWNQLRKDQMFDEADKLRNELIKKNII